MSLTSKFTALAAAALVTTSLSGCGHMTPGEAAVVGAIGGAALGVILNDAERDRHHQDRFDYRRPRREYPPVICVDPWGRRVPCP